MGGVEAFLNLGLNNFVSFILTRRVDLLTGLLHKLLTLQGCICFKARLSSSIDTKVDL